MSAFLHTLLLSGVLAAVSACTVVQLAEVQDGGPSHDGGVGTEAASGVSDATSPGCLPPDCDAG
ncbi:MAG TPA: hypothetical protein VHS09_08550, partial [Polyangiaceae bacterium]|nr:hypothetical protein [Polyangiaceae bacterium]